MRKAVDKVSIRGVAHIQKGAANSHASTFSRAEVLHVLLDTSATLVVSEEATQS